MQDFYEILQVHPKADQETIHSAYERLSQRYHSSRLEGAADELVEMAKHKRDYLDRAYAVLSDRERRADYDRAQQVQKQPPLASPDTMSDDETDEERIDYRPLPPARRQERADDFDSQPLLSNEQLAKERVRQKKRSSFLGKPSAIAAVLTFIIGFVSLLITEGAAPHSQHGAMPQGEAVQQIEKTTVEKLTSQYDEQIVLARQATNSAPQNPNAWIGLGNTLYDSVQVVLEHVPESESYLALLPRWIEASEAYSKALALQPDNAVVRSDMAVSLCNYGSGMNDPSYTKQGIEEARRAFEQNSQEGRVLLNLGTCLVSQNPPQTQEAIESWHKILQLSDIDEGIVTQAQRMIAKYQEKQPSPSGET